MSSYLRNIQRRNIRANDPVAARKLRGQRRGTKLGVTNEKAPKPLSGAGHGSQRGTNKRPFRSSIVKAPKVKFAPHSAGPTRAERKLDHQIKMARKGYRADPRQKASA